MYNLLLVDDEPCILDGLCYNIDWDGLDIQEVFRAKNTDEALEILQNHRVDLVITDIQMPGRDGLSMGEIILRQWPYTKIIILSGYQNFEYAQRAIHVRAFRYLVKPVRYEILRQAAREALEELQSDLQKKSILENVQQKMTQMKPFLQERYLIRWLYKDAAHPWEDGTEPSSYGMDIRPKDWGFWVIVLIDKQKGVSSGMNLSNMALDELCRGILSEGNRMIHFLDLEERNCYLFLDASKDKIDCFFRRTVERLEAFLFSMQESLACRASIFWDFPAALPELGERYRDLDWRIRIGSEKTYGVISGPEIPEGAKPAGELKALQLLPSFTTLLTAQCREKALKRVDKIFEELKQQGCLRDQALQVYHTVTGALVADSLQRQIKIGKWGENLTEFLENAGTIGNFDAFYRQCRAAVTQYLNYLVKNQQTQGGKLVAQIKQMVEEQLSGNLSVGSLAVQCHYNAIYLSRLFKEKTGISLQDYIIRQRMEKAKLLLDGGAKVGDVASAVGYENFPHFSRAFKKAVGVSPKQYQNKSGAEE